MCDFPRPSNLTKWEGAQVEKHKQAIEPARWAESGTEEGAKRTTPEPPERPERQASAGGSHQEKSKRSSRSRTVFREVTPVPVQKGRLKVREPQPTSEDFDRLRFESIAALQEFLRAANVTGRSLSRLREIPISNEGCRILLDHRRNEKLAFRKYRDAWLRLFKAGCSK